MNFDFFVNIFFPPACISCTRKIAGGALCETCQSNLAAGTGPLTAVSDGTVSYLIGAGGDYENEVLQALVHGLKFRFLKGAAEPLAEIICTYAAHAFPPASYAEFMVVPVPLSKQRLRSRGFNQSELIGKIFAERMGLPFAPRSLARIRHRKPQSETTSLAERKENILGCFTALSRECAGKNIILIDDVTTSGATFMEAARALKFAGAEKIIALAAARA